MNRRLLTAVLCMLLLVGGCAPKEKAMDEIKKGGFAAGAAVHDPSVVAGGDGKYYIFGSHMEAAASQDLRNWNSFASGVNAKNPLFTGLFEKADGAEHPPAFAFVGNNEEGGYSVWAPDVVYNKAMGKYLMYFCTTSSYIKSNLCFAMSDTLEGPYSYVDTILYSGFNRADADQTNLLEITGESTPSRYLQSGKFNNSFYPNCIDPTVFYDQEGRMWMTYGSWSGGIFLLELDEKTGYPIHPEPDESKRIDRYYGISLAGGFHNSVEGPYILYHPQSKYYYLFVSYGGLVTNGGYNMRLFRSRTVEGPYTDAAGNALGAVVDHSLYGLKLMGNYSFPSLSYTYMAPGHNSAFIDGDGKTYLVYHQRFDDGKEFHEPRVHQLFATQEGWLVAAPFATAGESLSEKGYTRRQVQGSYFLQNHGTDTSAVVHPNQQLRLEPDGTITGEVTGSYTLAEDGPYITLTLDGQDYSGVVVEMTDEAGNPTLCFTAAGPSNQSVWGVHFE